jgi:hypothetical protein
LASTGNGGHRATSQSYEPVPIARVGRKDKEIMQFVGGALTATAHRDINPVMITSKAIPARLIGTLLA